LPVYRSSSASRNRRNCRNYPVWDVAFGAGLLIALVAILHVFVSHFAAGGGLFLVLTERRARRKSDAAMLGWLGYLAMGGLALSKMRLPLFLTSAGGFLFAFRLTMIEEFALEARCFHCVISQMIVAILLLLSLGWFVAQYLSLKRSCAHMP